MPRGAHLLLATPDGREVLRGAITLTGAALGKAPTSITCVQPGADPNDLAAQRWGVIAPVGAKGDAMLAAIQPLCELRASEQGAPLHPAFRCPAGLRGADAAQWIEVELMPAAVGLTRPGYLLLLGDLDELSADLQMALAGLAFVGRLCAETLDGYADYVAKLLKQRPAKARRRMLADVRDGTIATQLASEALVQPVELALGGATTERVEIIEDGGVDYFLDRAAVVTPSVLLSTSHGLGAPAGGWASFDEQRARQGSMLFGNGRVLQGAEVGRKPFLPGGVWVYFACFGAGTPERSLYASRFHQMRGEGGESIDRAALMRSLPPPGRSFVSRVALACLANPRGPVGMVSHLDLAWSYAFEQGGSARWDRFAQLLAALGNGNRIGPAVEILRKHAAAIDAEILRRLEAAGEDSQDSGSNQTADAERWMTRTDLRGYVVLGDPAARVDELTET